MCLNEQLLEASKFCEPLCHRIVALANALSHSGTLRGSPEGLPADASPEWCQATRSYIQSVHSRISGWSRPLTGPMWAKHQRAKWNKNVCVFPTPGLPRLCQDALTQLANSGRFKFIGYSFPTSKPHTAWVRMNHFPTCQLLSGFTGMRAYSFVLRP